MRPQQRGKEQQSKQLCEPAAHAQCEQRDHEQVGRGERREERRGEAPEDNVAALVVDEILRQPREPLVGEAELVLVPTACVPPERERDQIDVEQADRGHAGRRREDRSNQRGTFCGGEREEAAERVRLDRQKIVARGVDDTRVRRSAAERRLRDQAVDDDEAREREREPVAEDRPERPRPGGNRGGNECAREQDVLPRRENGERTAAYAGAPELRHHDVVQREADDEDVQRPDRATNAHRGPTATSVIRRLSTSTL